MGSAPTMRFYNQRLLDLGVYLTLIVLAGIGLIIVPGLPTQIAVMALVVAFGLIHAFGFQAGRIQNSALFYFIAQMAVIVSLIWLSRPSDVFNLLFFVLGIQAVLILPIRTAIAWVITFYIVDSASGLWSRGAEGLVSVLYYAAISFLVGVFGVILHQTELARREKQQLLEELQAAQRQLQELAVAEERNRLARDLHDSVKQQAFALSAQLDAVQSLIKHNLPVAQTHLAQAEQLADALRQELANLIFELRPAAVGPEGLIPALQRYAESWSRQSGIAATVSVQHERALPVETQYTLFRIAQEALANVARHSQAHQVELNLAFEAEALKLTIRDDGQGFDPSQITAGIGSHSMRERAATLPQGRCSLESTPGQGTTVTVSCAA